MKLRFTAKKHIYEKLAVGSACALVVMLNSAVWLLVTPTFHVPDETVHIAYAQYLAETGKLPAHPSAGVFSEEESVVFDALGFNRIVGNQNAKPPWDKQSDQSLDQAINRSLVRRSEGGLTPATNNPPLYYLAQVVPYKIAGHENFLTRVLAMRLFSAFLSGLTTLFIFLFLREVLPRSRWVWPVGALCAGLQPVFAFISSGVNNDAGLFVAASACIWALARTFNRGLSMRSGLLIGTIFGLGLLTKATMVGFAPGLALAAIIITKRQWKTKRNQALYGLLAAMVGIAIPLLAYGLALNTVWDRPIWSGATSIAGQSGAHAGFSHLISYLWQFYLPPLPFMDYRIGSYPLWEVWFKSLVGRFGWLDYGFPNWAYKVALLFASGLFALVCRVLWNARTRLKQRVGEVLTYLVVTGGLLTLIGVAGFQYRIQTGFVFEQGRYLLPLLSFYGLFIALSAKAIAHKYRLAFCSILLIATLFHGLVRLLLH